MLLRSLMAVLISSFMRFSIFDSWPRILASIRVSMACRSSMVIEVAAVAVSSTEYFVASSSFESSSPSSKRIFDWNLTTRGKRLAMVDEVNLDVSSSLARVISAQLFVCWSNSGARSSLMFDRDDARGGREDLEESVAMGAVPSSYAAVHKSRMWVLT